MDVESVAGDIALASSILLTCIGLPIQIRHMYRVKSSRGFSAPMMIISFTAYVAWLVYGAVKSPVDNRIVLANIPGVFFGAIIIFLIFRYRDERPEPAA